MVCKISYCSEIVGINLDSPFFSPIFSSSVIFDNQALEFNSDQAYAYAYA